MAVRRTTILTAGAWLGVWGFWLVVTRSFHPTLELAVIVTTALVLAYATAATINHTVLLPDLRRTGRRGRYAGRLLLTMVVLTGAALLVIRRAYVSSLGPDPDPLGAWKHFGIDLFGMAVHLGAAAFVAAAWRRTGWN